jgi:hypothetical protein
MTVPYNPANLYVLLLNTGLQTKDNALYQVINSLITATLSIPASSAGPIGPVGPAGSTGATGATGPTGPAGSSSNLHTATAIGSASDISNMYTTPFLILTGVSGQTIVPIILSIRVTPQNGSFSTGRAFTIGYSKTIGGNTYGQNSIHVSTSNLIESGLVDPRYIFMGNYEDAFDFNSPGGGEGSPEGKSIVMILNGGGTGFNVTGSPSGVVMDITMTYALLDSTWTPI